ncbi:MAG TPA: glycosyltransferase [Phycisphaerales bacterium]|nr:glycosyltransferase [Phycisphaerales bacterium]
MAERNLQTDPASSDHVHGAPTLAEDGATRPAPGPMLFEVAWEVCNQVGGIYQVLRSKAPLMVQRWGDRYCLIGPWDAGKAQVEFEEAKPAGWVSRALQQLRDQGLVVHYGRWLVPGRPRVMLIEHWPGHDRMGPIKYEYWADHRIESPSQDYLIDGVISFADGVRRLLEALAEHRPYAQTRATSPGVTPQPMLAHFHEWMGGLAIPAIRKRRLPIATVFTTHATLLGRYIASSRDDFYDQLPWLNQEWEAKKYNVVTQHTIERACAHGAHVFTTVSSVTAEECNYLLGRPVDVVTPNGLTIGLYNAGHEQQRLHGVYKDEIHKFTMGHFFPSYGFDLDKTLYFFTSGRYEPKNKGFDVVLEAMARLNAELKAQGSDKTVVCFVISKKATKSLNPLAMEKRGVLNELEEVCGHITEGVGRRLFSRAAAGEKLRLDDLIDEYWMLRYRRAQHALKQHCLPMVVTHILEEDQQDPVLNQIRNLQLFNRQEDPVKVVYHPDFITPTNRLWGVEYDQFVRGCHLGLFPSLYEPWGYTPLECAAMGVPAVTSDLAGFGRYVQENYQEPEKSGLMVLKRRGRGFFDAAAELAKYLVEFCKMERRDRIALRNEVDRRSWDFDWSKLGKAYHAAHDLALARFMQETGGEGGGVAMVSAAALSGRAIPEETRAETRSEPKPAEVKAETAPTPKQEPAPPQPAKAPPPKPGRVERKSGTR